MQKRTPMMVNLLIFIGMVGLSFSGHASSPSSSQRTPQRSNSSKTWYDQRIKNRGVIYFYDKAKPFYEFTNFFEVTPPLKIDQGARGNDLEWITTEQYYQAGKFTDNSIRDLIRTGSNAKWKDHKAASKGWGAWAFYVANQSAQVNGKQKVRNDWTTVMPATGMQRNINRMLVALRAKFRQNKALGQMLLATYPKVLVEDSPVDGYFGAGNPAQGIAQGTGENLLGRMLMHVRRELYREFVLNDTNPQRPFDTAKSFCLNYLLDSKNKI